MKKQNKQEENCKLKEYNAKIELEFKEKGVVPHGYFIECGVCDNISLMDGKANEDNFVFCPKCGNNTISQEPQIYKSEFSESYIVTNEFGKIFHFETNAEAENFAMTLEEKRNREQLRLLKHRAKEITIEEILDDIKRLTQTKRSLRWFPDKPLGKAIRQKRENIKEQIEKLEKLYDLAVSNSKEKP